MDDAATERIQLGGGIYLRQPTEDDAEELCRAVAESLETLTPWMPWAAHEPMSVRDRRALIGEWREDFRRGANYSFVIFNEAGAIGVQGLHRRVGPGGLELGYWIHPAYAGRGVSSHAAAALTAWAFSFGEAEFVEVHNDAANLASQAVARKAGYQLLLQRPSPVDAPGETGVELVWEARMGRWKQPQLKEL